VQFFDWMAMAGEARRRGWLDWRQILSIYVISDVLNAGSADKPMPLISYTTGTEM